MLWSVGLARLIGARQSRKPGLAIGPSPFKPLSDGAAARARTEENRFTQMIHQLAAMREFSSVLRSPEGAHRAGGDRTSLIASKPLIGPNSPHRESDPICGDGEQSRPSLHGKTREERGEQRPPSGFEPWHKRPLKLEQHQAAAPAPLHPGSSRPAQERAAYAEQIGERGGCGADARCGEGLIDEEAGGGERRGESKCAQPSGSRAHRHRRL